MDHLGIHACPSCILGDGTLLTSLADFSSVSDVGFRDVSFTLAMLSWTVDGIVQTKLVSVELFVKRLSDTKDVDWQPLSHLSFNHPVGSKSAQALRFGRDLNVIHGEAYRANVTLISGIKNMTSTVDVTTGTSRRTAFSGDLSMTFSSNFFVSNSIERFDLN